VLVALLLEVDVVEVVGVQLLLALDQLDVLALSSFEQAHGDLTFER
jgi:hypothetical protein